MQYALGFSTAIAGVTIDASSQRTFASYSDLAEITTPWNSAIPGPIRPVAIGDVGDISLAARLHHLGAPPRALDRLSLTFPQALSWAALNLSYVNETQSDGVASRIASVGVSHNFSAGGSAFAQASPISQTAATAVSSSPVMDLRQRRDRVEPIQFARGVGTATTQVSNPQQEIGSLGWSATDTEGGARTTQAQASYLSPYGRATVTASEYGLGSSSSVVGSGEFAGSVSVLGASVLPCWTTSDSFCALVHAPARPMSRCSKTTC